MWRPAIRRFSGIRRRLTNCKKKTGKRQKQLQRNLEKLNVARGAHQTKMDDIVKRLKTAQEKHQVVFQCAHHAFWIAQDRYFSTVDKLTQSVRWESLSVQERITGIDLQATEKLEPILRAVALLPPVTASEVTGAPQIKGSSSMKDQDEVQPAAEREETKQTEEDESAEKDTESKGEENKGEESKGTETKAEDKKVAETPKKSTPQKAVESEPVTPEVRAM